MISPLNVRREIRKKRSDPFLFFSSFPIDAFRSESDERTAKMHMCTYIYIKKSCTCYDIAHALIDLCPGID